MIFAIILGFIVFIACVCYGFYEDEKLFDTVIGLFVGVLITLLWTVIAFSIGLAVPTNEVYKTETVSICALADKQDVSGSFYLGSGNISSKSYYYYVTKQKDGGMKIQRASVGDSTLYEDEETDPYYTVVYKHNSDPILNFFFMPKFTTEYSFHIPKDSIKYNFNVDMGG